MATPLRNTLGLGHGHNQTSHKWHTNLYGTDMHPREWNSGNIEHTDAINYGRMSAIDRALMTLGKKTAVGPALRDNPIPVMSHGTGGSHSNVAPDWDGFRRKYVVSEAETKYDIARSLSTFKRSEAYINRTPRHRAPSTAALRDSSEGRLTTYPK